MHRQGFFFKSILAVKLVSCSFMLRNTVFVLTVVVMLEQFPDQLPILPMELAELSFDDNEDEDEEGESDDNDSSTEEAEQEPVEGVGAAEGDGDDATTLSEGELSENKDERIQGTSNSNGLGVHIVLN